MSESFLSAVAARSADTGVLPFASSKLLTDVPKEVLCEYQRDAELSDSAALTGVCRELLVRLDDEFWEYRYAQRWPPWGLLKMRQDEPGASPRRRCMMREALERECWKQLIRASGFPAALAAHMASVGPLHLPVQGARDPGETHGASARTLLQAAIRNRLSPTLQLRGMRLDEYRIVPGSYLLVGTLVLTGEGGAYSSNAFRLALQASEPPAEGLLWTARRVLGDYESELAFEVGVLSGEQHAEPAESASAQNCCACSGKVVLGVHRGTQMDWWIHFQARTWLYFHALIDVGGSRVFGTAHLPPPSTNPQVPSAGHIFSPDERNEIGTFVLYAQQQQ